MATTAPASETIDIRFAELIQQFGLTKNAFAVSLGKTASVVQHLIDGRNKPGYDLLCKVFEIYPNVSRDWLLLGRGPMLISGNPAPKPAEAPAPPEPAAAEPDLEPIDLSDLEGRTPRRNGARLQPDEIKATLALAAAATQPARPAATAEPAAAPAATHTPPPAPTANNPTSASTAPALGPEKAAAPPAAEQAAASASPNTTPAPPIDGPDAFAAILQTQHLQHQLALAELRNQHLLEQQQMLREMLAMTRG